MNVRIVDFKQEMNSKGEVVDWVLYGPGDDLQKTQTWARVKELIPPEKFERDSGGIKEKHMRWMWEQIEPAYKAWKDGEEIPVTGTPLGAWAGANKSQVKALKVAGIKTVEEVRDMPESMIGKVRIPDIRALITQAKIYLENQDKAQLARQADEQSKKIDGLEAKLEEALSMLAEKEAPKKKAKAAA